MRGTDSEFALSARSSSIAARGRMMMFDILSKARELERERGRGRAPLSRLVLDEGIRAELMNVLL